MPHRCFQSSFQWALLAPNHQAPLGLHSLLGASAFLASAPLFWLVPLTSTHGTGIGFLGSSSCFTPLGSILWSSWAVAPLASSSAPLCAVDSLSCFCPSWATLGSLAPVCAFSLIPGRAQNSHMPLGHQWTFLVPPQPPVLTLTQTHWL